MSFSSTFSIEGVLHVPFIQRMNSFPVFWKLVINFVFNSISISLELGLYNTSLLEINLDFTVNKTFCSFCFWFKNEEFASMVNKPLMVIMALRIHLDKAFNIQFSQ